MCRQSLLFASCSIRPMFAYCYWFHASLKCLLLALWYTCWCGNGPSLTLLFVTAEAFFPIPSPNSKLHTVHKVDKDCNPPRRRIFSVLTIVQRLLPNSLPFCDNPNHHKHRTQSFAPLSPVVPSCLIRACLHNRVRQCRL